VTGEGEDILFRPCDLSPAATMFCQRIFPSFRLMQIRLRFFWLSGDVRKIEFSHTIGVEPLCPGNGTAQTIFSVLLQVVGKPDSSAEPLKFGPRHCGQLPANVAAVATSS